MKDWETLINDAIEATESQDIERARLLLDIAREVRLSGAKLHKKGGARYGMKNNARASQEAAAEESARNKAIADKAMKGMSSASDGSSAKKGGASPGDAFKFERDASVAALEKQYG